MSTLKQLRTYRTVQHFVEHDKKTLTHQIWHGSWRPEIWLIGPLKTVAWFISWAMNRLLSNLGCGCFYHALSINGIQNADIAKFVTSTLRYSMHAR